MDVLADQPMRLSSTLSSPGYTHGIWGLGWLGEAVCYGEDWRPKYEFSVSEVISCDLALLTSCVRTAREVCSRGWKGKGKQNECSVRKADFKAADCG